jgi:hypothetical protein
MENKLVEAIRESITIEPNNGLTGSQVEQARQKGRAGENIYFTNTDTTL